MIKGGVWIVCYGRKGDKDHPKGVDLKPGKHCPYCAHLYSRA